MSRFVSLAAGHGAALRRSHEHAWQVFPSPRRALCTQAVLEGVIFSTLNICQHARVVGRDHLSTF
jgi:hypothetical protein